MENFETLLVINVEYGPQIERGLKQVCLIKIGGRSSTSIIYPENKYSQVVMISCICIGEGKMTSVSEMTTIDLVAVPSILCISLSNGINCSTSKRS